MDWDAVCVLGVLAFDRTCCGQTHFARFRFCSFYFAVGRLWKTLDFGRESVRLIVRF
jgi:hypothetical protein